MNRLDWRWAAAWAALGLVALGLETAALVSEGRGDTLSESIWALLGIHPLVWFIGLGAAAWAIRHLWWRKR
jgi:hypothetical protein